jgi:hypothetical protein
LWRTKTLVRSANGAKGANKRLFSKNSKKIGKKYMKVVTNGGMWCILIVSLGEVYPFPDRRWFSSKACKNVLQTMGFHKKACENACKNALQVMRFHKE